MSALREWYRGAQEHRSASLVLREQVDRLRETRCTQFGMLGCSKYIASSQVGLQVEVDGVVQDAKVASDRAYRACTTTLDDMALFDTTWRYKA